MCLLGIFLNHDFWLSVLFAVIEQEDKAPKGPALSPFRPGYSSVGSLQIPRVWESAFLAFRNLPTSLYKGEEETGCKGGVASVSLLCQLHCFWRHPRSLGSARAIAEDDGRGVPWLPHGAS